MATTTTRTRYLEDVPEGVTLRGLDGGAYQSLPNAATFFPKGVWLAKVTGAADVTEDLGFGLNVYTALDPNGSVLDPITGSGMYLFVQANEWEGTSHAAITGWFPYDEADLTYRPGSDPWSGVEGWNTCIPIQDSGGKCGYTVMDEMASRCPPGTDRYTNYGKEILYNFNGTEAQEAVFVNTAAWGNIVSADHYFFTDPDIQAADRYAAQYGSVVTTMRHLDSLDGTRKAVWAFVELGYPWSNSPQGITTAQMRAAVWHSIIAGARGVVYFNHNFGGPFSFNILRDNVDPAMTAAVTTLNGQLDMLATVLNGNYADGFATITGGTAQVMSKRGPDGAWYVFVGDGRLAAGAQTVTVAVAAGTTADVVFESRSVPISGGSFSDSFANGDAVHIYKVT